MSDAKDRGFMKAALEEADKAVGRTRPNPPVGCVIVRDAEIVARGYTYPAGLAHAEINALRDWDGERPEDCTLYSTLEPCCTHGRTPPCTEAIIEAGIGRVVIGVRDFIPRVDGKGVELLRSAGVEVVEGVMEEESRRVAMPFFRGVIASLPFVSVKWAMTLDGKIATRTGSSRWITGERARARVHHLRNEHDVIMVGSGTLMTDDPRLNARAEGARDPHRAILDTKLRIPLDAALLELESEAETWIYCGPEANPEKRASLEAIESVEVVTVPVDEAGLLDLKAVLTDIYRRGMLSVFVEGGGKVVGSLADADLIDRVYAFIAPKLVGGEASPTPISGAGVGEMSHALELVDVRTVQVGEDVLIVGDRPGRQPWDIEDHHQES